MSEFDVMSERLSSTGIYKPEEGTVIYAELMAYAEGLDLVFGRLEELLRECFVSTACTYGLTNREELIKCLYFDQTLEGRRRRLLCALSVSTRDFTEEASQKLIGIFNLAGTFSYSNSNRTITFNCTSHLSQTWRDRLREELKMLLPVWTDLVIVTP